MNSLKRTSMRPVRAYRPKTETFLTPDTISYEDLALFYGILAGFAIQGEFLQIDESTMEFDKNGNEIFENDIVIVHSVSARGKVYEEIGIVSYVDGMYSIVNDNGLLADLTVFEAAEDYYIEIITNRYEYEKVAIFN